MIHDNVRSVPDVASAYDAWAKTYDTDPNDTRELAGVVLRQSRVNFDGSSDRSGLRHGAEHVVARRASREHVNGGIRAGLTLLGLVEWRDSGATYADPPRIVSAHFRA